MLPVKIFVEDGVDIPEYKTSGSVGFDVSSNEMNPIILKPGERRLIHTGLYMEIPTGYELQIRPRSGLSLKKGFVPVLGTIDGDYRGEIGIIAMNLSKDEDFVINYKDRVAQGIIAPIVTATFKKVNTIYELSETDRGMKGFGSTGV